MHDYDGSLTWDYLALNGKSIVEALIALINSLRAFFRLVFTKVKHLKTSLKQMTFYKVV